MNMEEPRVSVGILSDVAIRLELSGTFEMQGVTAEGDAVRSPIGSGTHRVALTPGGMEWNGGETWTSLCFVPQDEEQAFFELKEVTIGVGFHWQRRENQRFRGTLEIITEGGMLTAVNHVRVEAYLASVISSEMSAHASLELLKAHAVISRSWLLAGMQCIRTEYPQLTPRPERYRIALPGSKADGQETLKWYERDAHTRFDVCADDHCQRYQGITRVCREAVKQAIAATRGQVLLYEGRLCDTRFSKCCGGASEEFPCCWDEIRYPYLARKRDLLSAAGDVSPLPDLTQEEEADRWIRSAPAAFCHTADPGILRQVLNSYDRETTHFYRWRVAYSQEELSRLIRQRTGEEYGDILDLVPMARGTSGRLWKLKIVGTRQTRLLGKELEIRRTLSPSHLYSSAFVVDKEGTLPAKPNESGIASVPARFTLTGAGWGHGVGLCQIGAAVMGARGYGYEAILRHYFQGAGLSRLYE